MAALTVRRVATECIKTDGRVVVADNDVEERIVTLGGVPTGIAAFWWWLNRLALAAKAQSSRALVR